MKKFLLLIALFLITGCATTDNLGDLSKRFDDIKKIENECYDIFKRFYITEDLKLATDNEDQMDDIVAYLYYLVVDAPRGISEFKLSFEYNYYFK